MALEIQRQIYANPYPKPNYPKNTKKEPVNLGLHPKKSDAL